jgi:hypothetical protein
MDQITGTEESAIIMEVRRRYRICNYLLNTGMLWMVAGYAGAFLTRNSGQHMNEVWLAIGLVGAGIFSAAFALTLAIYRCPVCDKYLSRFRPDKRKCPGCGTTVRETLSGRP